MAAETQLNVPSTLQAPAPPPPASPPAQGAASPAMAAAPAPLWLQRISLFILVLFCLYLGVIVAALPWWTSVWDRNLFFMSHPRLLAILELGPVRGIISGLGLLDIWIGISEAIHYRENATTPL